MHFYTNGKLAYLKIPKNACMSWTHVLDNMGWEEQDLYIPRQPLDDLVFFGLLREPEHRHTLGLVQYLKNERLEHLLKDEFFQRILVSAVFDEHTYNIHSMVPSDIIKRTNWFILDDQHYNYEQLVRNFLRQHNVDLPAVPRINVSSVRDKQLQTQINELKVKHYDSHQKLAKNFLGSDLRLYRTQILNQNIWDTK
jgi:hypothetical protein